MNLDPESLNEIVRVARELDGRDREDYLRDVTQGDPAQLAQIKRALAESTGQTPRIDTDADTVAGPPSGAQALSAGSSADPNAPTQDQGAIPTTLRRDLFKLTEQPGTMVGRYKLLQKIGEGGFGAVYMAEQEEPVRRRVALKIIKAGMDTHQVIARFEAERQALAMMDHPFIARVLDAGATDAGRPYFVMELVKGVPVTEYCDQAKLDTKGRLKVFKDICSAIQHAHQKGIIHRDLKPSNVMVTLHGGEAVVKVIDFGIAKATDQRLTEKTLFTSYGQMIGTPAYMSPEQAVMSGLDIDTRSDIYSLGVLLYELLAGRPPLDDKTLREAGFDEMRRLIREQDPPKPSTRLSTMDEKLRSSIADNRHVNPQTLSRLLRGELDWIVMKALEKDRARRYESASAFAHDIDRYLNNEPVEAAAPSSVYRLRKYVRRNKGPVTTAALIALALVAGTGVSTWQAVRATRAEQLAQDRLGEVQAQRDAKEKEARDAEAIATFFGDVLRRPDPRLDGRSITVAQSLDRASNRIDTELANQPLRQARLRVVLGRTYDGLGLYDKAIEHLEKARDTLRSDLGPKHPDTLAAIQRLASAYHDSGRLNEALKLREAILATRRQTLGADHADTLGAMNELATSYYFANRRDEAIALYEQALKSAEQSQGEDGEVTLKLMNNLANLYRETHRENEALALRERVLASYETVKGPAHPDTIEVMNNLANLYSDQGLDGKALAMREKVAKLVTEVYGEDNAEALLAQENLASSYHKGGQIQDALAMRERVLKLRRQINGPAHPRTLAAMNNLAISYNAADQPDKAMTLREEMRDAAEREYGKDHKLTHIAMHNLGNSYQENGRWDESLALRRAVLELCLRKYGQDGKDTLWAMDSLATTLAEHGETEQAVRMLEDAASQPTDDLSIALKLAELYVWSDRQDDYEALRGKAIKRIADNDETLEAQAAVTLLCLRPITNEDDAGKVLTYAREHLKADGTQDRSQLDNMLVLGLAEYRAGEVAKALRLFTDFRREAGERKDDRFAVAAVTAGFYTVQIIQRQGDSSRARQLYDTLLVSMKPMPEEPQKPLAGQSDYDALLQWLAYREATALMQ